MLKRLILRKWHQKRDKDSEPYPTELINHGRIHYIITALFIKPRYQADRQVVLSRFGIRFVTENHFYDLFWSTRNKVVKVKSITHFRLDNLPISYTSYNILHMICITFYESYHMPQSNFDSIVILINWKFSKMALLWVLQMKYLN